MFRVVLLLTVILYPEAAASMRVLRNRVEIMSLLQLLLLFFTFFHPFFSAQLVPD